MFTEVNSVSLPSGVPQVLPRGTSEPDSAAGHTADHSGPGLRPRLAGSQTIPADIKRARTECSGAAVRFVNCALCYLREHKQFSLMFSISVPALIFYARSLQLTEVRELGRGWLKTRAKRSLRPSSSSFRLVRTIWAGIIYQTQYRLCDTGSPFLVFQFAGAIWRKRSTRSW